MAIMKSGVPQPRRRAVFLALGLTGVLMLVAASPALGQAAVDQYIPSASPSGNHGGGGGAGGVDTPGTGGGASEGASAGAAGAGAAKGSLNSGGAGLTGFSGDGTGSGSTSGADAPGTDYPLTTFVFIVIGLLVVGGVTIAVVRRRRASHTA
jgi:hypothetical protein